MIRSRASRHVRSATVLGVIAAGLVLPAAASADDPTPLTAPIFSYGPTVDAGHGPVVSVLHGRFGTGPSQGVVAVATGGTDRDGNAAGPGVALFGQTQTGYARTQDAALSGDLPVAAVAAELEGDGGTSAVVVSRDHALARGSVTGGTLESVDWHSGDRHRTIALPATPVAVAVGRFLPGYGSLVAVSLDDDRLQFYVPHADGFLLVHEVAADAGPIVTAARATGAGDALVTRSGTGGARIEFDAAGGGWSRRTSGTVTKPFGLSAGAIASEEDPYGNRWYAASVNGTWTLSWFDRGLSELGGYLPSDSQLGAPMVMDLYGGPSPDVVATLDGNAFRALEITTERTTQTGLTSGTVATALDVDQDRRDDLVVAHGTGVTVYGNETGTFANKPQLSAENLTPAHFDAALGRWVVTSTSFDFTVPTDTGDRYQCQLAGGTWVECVGGAARALAVPGDGSYKLLVRRMVAGTKFWSAAQSIGFRVEATKPAVPVLDSKPAGLTSAAWFWLVPPATGTRTEYRVDATGDWRTASSPMRLELSDGPHRVSFRAVDVASGTASDTVDADFTLDATAPSAPTKLAGPGAVTTARSASFAFEGEPDASYECRLDQAGNDPSRGGVARTPSTWRACTSPFAVKDLSLGDHVVEVRQVDLAGNDGPIATWKWTVVEPTPDVVESPQPAKETVTTPEAPAAVAPVVPAPAPAAAPPSTPAPEKATVAARLAVGAPAKKGATPVATAAGRRVAVGCAAPGATDYRCTVTVTRGGKTVGQGRRSGSGVVPVDLDKATARKVQRLGGLEVRVTLTVRTEDGRTSKTQKTVRVLPRKVLVVPTDGLFAFDSATPSRKADALAKHIASQLDGARTITIVGHTDAKGAADVNRRLGQQRAEAFRRLLAKHGFDGKVAVESAGDTQPRTSNDTESGRALNRRVEIDVRY